MTTTLKLWFSTIKTTFANIGALTFGYTIGVLKDLSGGFSAGFYTLAGCCVVGLGLTKLLARERRARQG